MQKATGTKVDESGLALPVNDVLMPTGWAQTMAQTAYVWGWPLVNMLNRNQLVSKAPKPGLLSGVVPVAPMGHLAMLSGYVDPAETFIACPNQDVVYGMAPMSLDDEPVVAQVPDFGDRFWVYALYDQRTDQFGDFGKQYKTKPGFYLLVGPNWKGDIPKGIEAVVRSPTALNLAVPRIFMNDTPEDHKAIQATINQVMFYPLGLFDGTMKTTVWADLPTLEPPKADKSAGRTETKWVIPEKFFDEFGAVLDGVSPHPGEEALYAQFKQLVAVAKNSPELKKAITDTAVAAEPGVIAPFFQWKHNGVPVANGWNRSTNNAEFGLDYYNRTATAKSNMLQNRPSETQYYFTDNDTAGQQLTGTRSYSITFPAGEEPPVNGFWSLTLYDDRHLFHPNDLKRFSLGTKNKDLKRNPDGSLTLYAGATSPGSDKESNWLPAPTGTFSLYIRAYWPKQAVIDGTWKTPPIVAQ